MKHSINCPFCKAELKFSFIPDTLTCHKCNKVFDPKEYKAQGA